MRLAFGFDAGWALNLTMAAVAALTLASVAVYLREWVRHMGVNGTKPDARRTGESRAVPYATSADGPTRG